MKKRIIVRAFLSLAAGEGVFLVSGFIAELRTLTSVLFTAASVFFPILISSVLSFDLNQVRNQKIERKLESRIHVHKISSLTQYCFAAILFILSAFAYNPSFSRMFLSIAIGASVISIVYDIGVGIFGLPSLRKEISKAIRSETVDIHKHIKDAG